MRRWVRIKEHEQGKWSHFSRRIEQLLNTAIAVDGATKGNVQLFNPLVNGLQIVTQRGFDVQFLQQFASNRNYCGVNPVLERHPKAEERSLIAENRTERVRERLA
jgi:hypothetical protein